MMSQTKLSSFFQPNASRGRSDGDDGGGEKKATVKREAAEAEDEFAKVKKRVLSTIKAERTHREHKSESVKALGVAVDVKFDFALPENVRDAAGRRPEDPEYDGRTVLVPQEQYLKMSSFERQVWDVKRRLFDTVVFFRKGMFYELFEGDARIAHREFGMTFTLRASMVMCGFPATQFEVRGKEKDEIIDFSMSTGAGGRAAGQGVSRGAGGPGRDCAGA
jgi:hypothetical protein